MTDPVAPATITATQPASLKPVRWSFVLAWALTACATLLSLFAWLPWVYPQAAQLTPYGKLQLAQSSASGIVNPQTQATAPQSAQAGEPFNVEAIKQDSVKAATEAAAEVVAQTKSELTTVARDTAREAGEAAGQTAALQSVAPLLAATKIEDRLARGAAYQNQLEQLSGLLTEAERSDLAPLANGGTDAIVLAAQLDASRRSLLARYRESLATNWWDKLRARFAGLITIHNEQSVPDLAESDYNKLRMQIMHDDAAGALATLQMLPPVIRDRLPALEATLASRNRAQAAIASLQTRLAAAVPQAH